VKAWAAAGEPGIRLAVNLSARQFRDKGLAAMVRRVLEESALAPRLLKLEITESAVMHNAEEAAAILAELKALGVSVAVDDFGTGYSSLAYLQRFPIDQLKIDRSFVRDVAHAPAAAALVRGIIGLARSLGLETVAEGVETREQRDYLAAAGCDKIQGFLFSRPLPGEEFLALLRRHASGRMV
jgi:EAL domain-containing protein (putative c-di-GMP-specific phosphodiesterase class I)